MGHFLHFLMLSSHRDLKKTNKLVEVIISTVM